MTRRNTSHVVARPDLLQIHLRQLSKSIASSWLAGVGATYEGANGNPDGLQGRKRVSGLQPRPAGPAAGPMPKATIGSSVRRRHWWRYDARQTTPQRGLLAEGLRQSCLAAPAGGPTGGNDRWLIRTEIDSTAASEGGAALSARAIAPWIAWPGCYEYFLTALAFSRRAERPPFFTRPVVWCRCLAGWGDFFFFLAGAAFGKKAPFFKKTPPRGRGGAAFTNPCCGSGGMFAQSENSSWKATAAGLATFHLRPGGSNATTRPAGSLMNLALRRHRGRPARACDSFRRDPLFPDLRRIT